MKADTRLPVSLSNRNNAGCWQVFATNSSGRFVFGVRNFADFKSVERYAETFADRSSCRLVLHSSRFAATLPA
jgi:hypothetical protein